MTTETTMKIGEFLTQVAKGATVLAHPDTIRRIKEAGLHFPRLKESPFLEEGTLYALRVDPVEFTAPKTLGPK